MTPIIKVENLGKKYILSHRQRESYTALRDVIAEKFRGLGRRLSHPFTSGSDRMSASREEFWALNDVSFDVNQGERIGIIGRNGAGKSTLLKILSRITEPTRGRVSINGRVASLLEVGTGFHPELTGRENIFLNGAILGMTRHEIRRKFDEIVAFAEVEKFLDTPVKHFSSGMYVRLAFAVAAHLEPEILLVDEVLAVGDATFQKKCLGKMEEVSKSEGRTILFVSHNLTAIQNLCGKALYLDKGALIRSGKATDVVETYLADCVGFASLCWQGQHPDTDALRVECIRVVSSETSGNDLFISDDVCVRIQVTVFRTLADIAFELFVHTIEGVAVFSSFTDTMPISTGRVTVSCVIPKNTLNTGQYSITVGISKNFSTFIVKIEDAVTLSMLSIPEGLGWQGEWPGVARPRLKWEILPDQGQDIP
jgi:lipopolysaccharide transport system ATP-binding protein